LTQYLTFTVIAAIVTTCGTLLGLFLKDFLFVYYFDSLREKRTLEKISKKFKDPILLSAAEFYRRVVDYINDYSNLSNNSNLEVLFDKSEKMVTNYANDKYFLKYKLRSTIYRFCALFGWLELYRQEITFLDSHSKSKSDTFLKVIAKVREAVADGQINTFTDKKNWHDRLIFREELRAIGEGMIEVAKEQKVVIGYGKFQQLLKDYEFHKEPTWLTSAINFFIDYQGEEDFRIKRFVLMRDALRELMLCLNKEYYHQQVKNK